MGKKRKDVKAKDVAMKFSNGLSILEVADKFNCSDSTIWRRLKKVGIEVPYRRKYYFNESIFKNCNSPEKAYWIGFLMADGSIDSEFGRHRLSLTLQARDINHLEKFKSFLGYGKNLEKKVVNLGYRNYILYRLQVDSRRMMRDLLQYGIVPRKTGKEQIKNIPLKYIKDFIRGYFDGDGCITESRTSQANFSISSGNKSFIKKIQGILVEACELNFTKLSIQTPLRTDGTRSLSWSLHYGGRLQGKRIFNYLYDGSSIYLDRKFTKFRGFI